MNKDEISKIKEHIEIHARRERGAVKITKILWKAVDELEHIADLEKENEQLKARVSYLEDNLRVARKDRERLQEDVAKGIEEFIKNKPATSLHLLANKELREELEKLKKENEQLQIENKKLQCCGNCTHRNAEEIVETCRLLKKYTQKKGCCSEWESITL